MNFTVVEAEQRSPEWFAARLGRLTGSRAADCLASIKSGGEAAARRNLRAQLVLERITNRPMESGYQSPAMLQGVEREADAVLVYEMLSGRVVQRTGFLSHDTLLAGCSLDGHCGDFEGFIEVKSPIPATHLDYLESGVIPGDYAKQLLHNFWITGAKWCDWMSYNPDFPEPLQAQIVTVERDSPQLVKWAGLTVEQYEQKAIAFLEEVQRKVESIQTMADLRGQLQRAAGAVA